MKLGVTLGYWEASPRTDTLELMCEAERLGYDAVFTAESWGSDALTPLAWYGSQTSTIKLGTSILQLSARTPASTAMHAITLDHLSNGRLILGLGLSGPQVVEGWYGQPFGKPLARTRAYVSILRQALAREAPVTNPGPHYQLPYVGPNSLGLGKALKPIVHPLRADIPIWLGAEGPKNIALAAEIADGWLADYFSPKAAPMYREWLNQGFAQPTARRTADEFEIATNCKVIVTDDVDGALDSMRPLLAMYIGGMGAKGMNFHKNAFVRMGYEKECDEIQQLFLEGKRDQAIAAVPRELASDVALVGPVAKIRDDLVRWEEAGVTMLVIMSPSVEGLRKIAEAVLG
jgi:F420-dependent oxidoreductase-like protein